MTLLETFGLCALLAVFGITMIWLRLWLANRAIKDNTIQKPMKMRKTG